MVQTTLCDKEAINHCPTILAAHVHIPFVPAWTQDIHVSCFSVPLVSDYLLEELVKKARRKYKLSESVVISKRHGPKFEMQTGDDKIKQVQKFNSLF